MFEIDDLLFQHEGSELRILRSGIEAGTVLLDPREVAMTEDLSVGVIDLQTAEQCY